MNNTKNMNSMNTMSSVIRKNVTFLLACLLFAVAKCVSADVVVIVHPSNTSEIVAENVVKIFLGKTKAFPGGKTAIPITSSSDITGEFTERVLNRSATQFKAYWSRRMFSGKGGPPQNLVNDAEVLEIVSKNPNTIGYIDKKNVTDSVKVVLTE